MKLSVVSTLYRSEPYLEEFLKRVSEAAQAFSSDHEILLVDDGSPDRSLDRALALKKSIPHITVIELSRNFGHHKAMMTGLEHAKGEHVFLIDSDLEEAPELLGRFCEEMDRGGWDVVYGVQQKRGGDLSKRFGGRIAWSLIKALWPIPVPRDQSTVRLMKAGYVKELIRYKEQMTAIGGLWVLTGFRQTGLSFDKGCRRGTSYSPLKRLGAFVDSITSFSERPLYGVFFLGCGMFLISLGMAVWLVIQRLTGTILSGWASVMVSLWALSGLILLCLGLVGIYISRIFIETKNRPYVIIRKLHA